MERWFKKIDTFHVPIGEITIVLEDVHRILWLPMKG